MALVNSRKGSRNVVLSLQTLPLRPDIGDDLRDYIYSALVGNNIRNITYSGVLSLICGHKGIASEAMHATSMRAITVI